ncbi:sialate O-acetylesterase [Spirosoma horti]
MTVFLRWVAVWGLLCHFFSVPLFAQLSITSPVPRMVFQRNLANEAIVTVTGMASPTATTVEARFVPLASGQGSVTAWTPLNFLTGSKAFRGKVTVSAGWYRLDVRSKAGTTILSQTKVNRVGVGEVFVIAGQSNAFGGIERGLVAAEDRVMCVDFRQDSLSEQLLPLQFSHINYGSNMGPSQPPHMYGLLGDKLVQRLNVPVLFIGAALGGTSSTEWRQSAAGNIGTTPNPAVYRRLGAVLLHYIARTGARAVLWHQGESDINSSTQTYFDNIKYVIEKSRQQVGSKPLAWVISRASYILGQTNPQVINAQNQLINNVANVFAGPATDNIIGTDNRPDNIHFQGNGRIRFTEAWDASLTASFFQNSVPFMPTDSAAQITSGYTLPLTRRPGEIIAAASLRSDPHESDNKYIAQIVRVSDGATVFESDPSTDNPIMVTLPFTLPNGQYRLRTRSTRPVVLGTLGEPFNVQQDASPSIAFPVYRQPIVVGTADSIIRRFGYRYEKGATTFWGLIQATAPVEVKLESLGSNATINSNWLVVPPSSQAPDFDAFSDFNYIQNYPAPQAGVSGVVPGRYRFSVRRQGDTGQGISFEMELLDGRQILYYTMEPIGAIPPVLTIASSLNSSCLSGSFNVAVDVTDSVMNSGNVFSVRLSDASGSFANETTIGSSTTSPITATLSPSLPAGTNYRIRVVGSNPNVASAPSQSLSICPGGADLSMSMSVSSRTPKPSQPVTITLVITNSGPADASNVRAQSLLPTGMDFIDATSTATSASANTVSINAGTVPNGVSKPFVFRVKPSQQGTFATAAQITASAQRDPDSQPNSGTGDGQDDVATVDLRTPGASGPVVASANPNQAPLPPTRPNQPPTDANKADLSLAIAASNLVVSTNQVISLSLVVSNLGGANATNVNVQTLLPTGWQLTVTTGLTINGQTVTGSVGTIPAGSSTTMILYARVPSLGTVRSQVFSASPTDPDSTPGNGYTKGEDDEAALSVRMR